MATGLNRILENASIGRLAYNDNLLSLETGFAARGAGVLSGCELTETTGLGLACSAGVVQGLKPATIPSFTGAAPNNATSYVWLDYGPDPAYGNGHDVDGNPVFLGAFVFTSTDAQPGSALACLGRVTTSAGAVTSLDTTGRVVLDRWSGARTFEIGEGVFVVDVAGGSIKTGGAVLASDGLGSAGANVTAGNVTLSDDAAATGLLIVTGTPGTARNLIVPMRAGKGWTVANRSDSALTVKATTGSGVTIAVGKCAQVAADGTDVFRVSPDV